ncbi:hypothetical protein BH11PAT4_BH11PAT4_8850 [soil metagenome]
MTCKCVATSSHAQAFGNLLLGHLTTLLGVEDLHTENLARLRRPDVVRGLQKLAPYITAWTHLPEKLPAVLAQGNGDIRVCAVFGSNLWRPVAERSVELYREGLVTHFIASGHKSKRFDKPEGVVLQDYLMDYGVNHNCIFVDTLATNTGENAHNAVEILTKEFSRDGLPEVLLVAKNYHTLRAMTALREHLAQAVGDGGIPSLFLGVADVATHHQDSWLDDPVAVEEVVGEVFRCKRYHKNPVRMSCTDRLLIQSRLSQLQALTL